MESKLNPPAGGSNVGRPAKFDVSVLNLKPNDKLVLTFDGCLNDRQLERIEADLKRWAPDLRVLILSKGWRMRVISAEEKPGAVNEMGRG